MVLLWLTHFSTSTFDDFCSLCFPLPSKNSCIGLNLDLLSTNTGRSIILFCQASSQLHSTSTCCWSPFSTTIPEHLNHSCPSFLLPLFMANLSRRTMTKNPFLVLYTKDSIQCSWAGCPMFLIGWIIHIFWIHIFPLRSDEITLWLGPPELNPKHKQVNDGIVSFFSNLILTQY